MAMRNWIFNFPVGLLRGFMDDEIRMRILEDILFYATLDRANQLAKHKYGFKDGEKVEEEEELFHEAMYDLVWSFNSRGDEECLTTKAFQRAIQLRTEWKGCARTGISREIYWDYRKNKKKKWQVAQLLGFLALKSIVGKSECAKTNNRHWMARMSGLNKEGDGPIDPYVSEFMTEYRIQKLKKLLQVHWNLKHYGRYTRGFWISFHKKVSLEDLILQAERGKSSNKIKDLKNKEEEARRSALAKLGIDH